MRLFIQDIVEVLKKHFGSARSGRAAGHSAPAAHLPPEARLARLTQQLLANRELVVSGRLKFVNLGHIRESFGARWPSLAPAIYATIDEIIAGYMTPGDVFFRHGDDRYVLVFAEDKAEEAAIRLVLIAADIKRRMLEKEKEVWEQIDISTCAVKVRAEELRAASRLPELGAIIDRHAAAAEAHAATRKPAPLPAEPPAVKSAAPAIVLPGPRTVAYLPFWHTKKSTFNTFICVFRSEYPADAGADSFAAHKKLFQSLPHSERVAADIALLQHVMRAAEQAWRRGEEIHLVCPVHYDTLYRTSSWAEYNVICRRIDPDWRDFICFMIFDIPNDVYRETLSAFAAPLKRLCKYLLAEVPLGARLDFEALRVSGFDAIGVQLPARGQDEKTHQQLAQFFTQARRHYIPLKFILGAQDLRTMSEAVCLGYDFVEGPAAHLAVEAPLPALAFRHAELFKSFLQPKQGGSKNG